jgi:hypothetical protein
MSIQQPVRKGSFAAEYVTRSGAPAIQTTARYTQVSREQIRPKLAALRGVQ